MCLAAAPRALGQGNSMQREWQDLGRAQDAYDRGVAAQERGDQEAARTALATAEAIYREVLKDDPLRTDLYAPLGDILIRRGQAAVAYVQLSQQVRNGVRDPLVRWQLARALHAMHQGRRALGVAQEVAAALPPRDEHLPAVLAFVGERAAELGEDGTALSALRQALAATGVAPPLAASCRRVMAGVLLRRGEAAEAAALLEALLHEAPGDVPTQRALADALCAGPRDADVERGLALRARLVAEHPNEAALLLEQGRALLAAGHAAEAGAVLARYVTRVPGDGQGTLWLARAYLATGQAGPALALLGRPPLIDGAEAAALVGRAQLMSRPPNVAAAAEALGRAVAARPGDGEACLDHAVALQRGGRAPQALDEARRCLALLPRDALAPWLHGTLLLGAPGRLDEAVARLRQAHKLAAGRGGARPMPAYLREAVPQPQPLLDEPTVARVVQATLAGALLQQGVALLPAPGARGGAGLPALREAVALWPSAAGARALALGLLGDGDAAGAVALLHPLAAGKEADAATLAVYGRALREAGQAPAALIALRRAADLGGKGAAPAWQRAVRMEQALSHLALARPIEAVAALGRAEDADMERLLAQASLAAARTALLDPGAGRAAAPYLQTAQRLHGRLVPSERAELEVLQVAALGRAGLTEAALHRLQTAEAELDRTVAPGTGRWVGQLLGPGGRDAVEAWLLLRGGQYNQGIAVAQRALAALPAPAGQRLLAGVAAAALGRAQLAYQRADYERAAAWLRLPVLGSVRGKAGEALRYDQGVLAFLRGKREEALALWNRVDARELPEKWVALGAAAEANGDRAGALESYRRYLQGAGEGPAAERVKHWVEVLERMQEAPRAVARRPAKQVPRPPEKKP